MPEERSTSSFASRHAVLVELRLVSGVQVEGSIYISGEPNRFSDAWEEIMRDPRVFVAVTDAETRSTDGTLEKTDGFWLVRKNDIVAVRPLKER